MKKNRPGQKLVCMIILSIAALFYITGCSAYRGRDTRRQLAGVPGEVVLVDGALRGETYESDEVLNLLRILSQANTAAAPFNPYALPIGVALTGIITLLEALRRKEKGGRKYAESKLTNGDANNGS